MSNFNELLNTSADDYLEQEKETIDYRPNPKRGKDGRYSSLIRFIPNWRDPKGGSFVDYFECWLTNPQTKKKMRLPCVSNRENNSEVAAIFWTLMKSTEEDKKKANIFRVNERHASFIQILRDDNAPNLKGKILLYSYGEIVHGKIQEGLRPDFGTPINPHAVFDATPFNINLSINSGGYVDYKACKFIMGDNFPISKRIVKKGDDGKNDIELVAFTKEDGIDLIGEYLKENTPIDDLVEYVKFRPWTDEERAHFEEVKRIVLPTTSVFGKSYSVGGGFDPGESVGASKVNEVSGDKPTTDTESNKPTVTESKTKSDSGDDADMNFEFDV